jgi:hypothetical protein
MAIWNLESDQIPVFFPITGAWIFGHMSILASKFRFHGNTRPIPWLSKKETGISGYS